MKCKTSIRQRTPESKRRTPRRLLPPYKLHLPESPGVRGGAFEEEACWHWWLDLVETVNNPILLLQSVFRLKKQHPGTHVQIQRHMLMHTDTESSHYTDIRHARTHTRRSLGTIISSKRKVSANASIGLSPFPWFYDPTS